MSSCTGKLGALSGKQGTAAGHVRSLEGEVRSAPGEIRSQNSEVRALAGHRRSLPGKVRANGRKLARSCGKPCLFPHERGPLLSHPRSLLRQRRVGAGTLKQLRCGLSAFLSQPFKVAFNGFDLLLKTNGTIQ